MLAIGELTRFFGGLAAVRDLSFEVKEGEILSLIGPNGAGKTTVFNLITGALLATRGTVAFRDREITGLRPHETAPLGLARTFQTTSLFGEETVLDNLIVAYRCRTRMGFWDALLRTGRSRRDEGRSREKAEEVIEFIGLAGLARLPAHGIPQESQKRLAIGLALATEPKLLLLDEPMGGLTEEENVTMMDLIRRVRGRGVTILLIEHKMKIVMNLSDRIVVLNYGQKIAEGAPAEVGRNQAVIDAYLGTEK
ncbi:MAG TPA: ABC transporter ATP-binding protein [Thermodesulfobacteriota bacterium]|nr:ABC transporter ATP-binding protein [Thermodesulfobacteriota bacterium]